MEKWRATYPKARAVTAQEIMADAAALAKLSPCHARKCMAPISTEQAPVTPHINAYTSMWLVAPFPPKTVCSTERNQCSTSSNDNTKFLLVFRLQTHFFFLWCVIGFNKNYGTIKLTLIIKDIDTIHKAKLDGTRTWWAALLEKRSPVEATMWR